MLTETSWRKTVEPFAQLTTFLPYLYDSEENLGNQLFGDKALYFDQHWLLMHTLLKAKNGVFTSSEYSSERDVARIQLSRPESSDVRYGFYFAARVPGKFEHEELQPFSSSDDSSALLATGKVYVVTLHVTGYRRLPGSRNRCTNSISTSSWQVAKNSWAFMLSILAGTTRLHELCRVPWLEPNSLYSSSGELDPAYKKYSASESCDQAKIANQLIGEPHELPGVLYHDAIFFNYSEHIVEQLPDKPSGLLPCSRERVTFKQIQFDLYTPAESDKPRLKLLLNISPEADIYEDEISYSSTTLVSNLFGLVGLYLGYCLLDFYSIAERFHLLWKHKIQE